MITVLKNRAGPWKMSRNKNKDRIQKNRERMLITGVSGLLGSNFAYYFKGKYDVLGIYLSHSVCIQGIKAVKADLSSTDSTKDIIHSFKPHIIIHCASLTNVDFCEVNQALTDLINVSGTQTVVESISNRKTKLVYISSDSVYDGGKGDFSENDPINPQNYYGLSKYRGELEVLKEDNSLILRTNIFGWNTQEKYSIAEWILYELSNKRQIKGFSDVFFSSIYTFDLAQILDMGIDNNLTGIFNCGSSTSLSKYQFALSIADRFNLEKGLIQPVSIDDFNLTAKRGKNLTLNVGKLKGVLNYNLPAINESVENFYRDYSLDLHKRLKA